MCQPYIESATTLSDICMFSYCFLSLGRQFNSNMQMKQYNDTSSSTAITLMFNNTKFELEC